MSNKDFKLSIVIPVYNSQETIGQLIDKIVKNLKDYDIEIVLVNDYSSDKSHEICLQKYKTYPQIIRYLKLSRNFGEHNAVMAGLNYSKGDYAVIMDDDFQNPPEEVVRIIDYMSKNKFDVLYTYYGDKKHSRFRNLGSWFNDKVGNIILKKPKDLYLSSFKCISRFIVDEIIKYKGPYPYIDGLILRATRNIGKIKVLHNASKKSKSGYTIGKLVSLWLNMFINFSAVPLRISFLIGCSLTAFGVLLLLFFVIDMYFWHHEGMWPAGWASLLVSIITFSGTQLISIGLLGEYIGKSYLTVNNTPQFIIREYYGDTGETIEPNSG